ncbi:MAG: LCP family protein [Oscillospiraceae bacterium]|nr:LCP family protein [Oscillospiraceae bacterium]
MRNGINTFLAKLRSFWTKKPVRIVTVVLCAVVAIVLALAVVYSLWEQPPEVVTVTPTPAPTAAAVSETEAPQSDDTDDADDFDGALVTDRSNGQYTFLIAGTDQSSGSTDTIIVGRMDTVEHTLNCVSIPRDTLVNNGWSNNRRINAVYWYSDTGAEALKKQITNLLGFEVDCYAVVDLDCFVDIVDIMGGVYFDVPIDMNYDDPTQDFYVHISAGYQLLSGEDAIKVVRFREGNNGSGYANGDLGRIETQQAFLMSVASQMLNLKNIPNLTDIITAITENTDTDLTAANIAFFARQFLKCDSDSITFATAPTGGVLIGGQSYVNLQVDEWLEMVNELLNPYSEPVTTANVNIINFNGSTVYSTSGYVAGSNDFFYGSSESEDTAGDTDAAESADTSDASDTAEPADTAEQPESAEE